MNLSEATKVAIRNSPDLIAYLEANAPKCEGDTIEKRAVTGAERQGWQNCVQFLKDSLVDAPQQPEAQNFID